MSDVSQWNVSDALNNSSPPDGWPENQAPSTVNDCARAMQGALARWYSDTDGTLTTGGSANAYTLTTNSGHTALADQSLLVFRASFANTGAATLHVDSLGAKSLRVGGSASLVANQILADVVYVVAYNATDDAYDIVGAFNNDASNLTQGELPDARLSSNVPLKDAPNTFTHNNGIRVANTGVSQVVEDTNSSADEGKWRVISTGNNSYAVQALNDAEDTAVTAFRAVRSGTTIIEFEVNATLLDGNFTNVDIDTTDFDVTATDIDLNGSMEVDGWTLSGAPTYDHTTASGIGKLGAPSRDVTATGNTAAADTGGTIRFTSGTGQTFTLDADPPEDAVLVLDNASGNSWTIAASGTLIWALDASTSNRTLADDGMAVALHRGSGVWVINGGGLT